MSYHNLTDSDLEGMHRAAQEEVRVSCDEFHAHSALQGCLVGPERAVAVCKLVEQLRRIQRDFQALRDMVPV